MRQKDTRVGGYGIIKPPIPENLYDRFLITAKTSWFYFVRSKFRKRYKKLSKEDKKLVYKAALYILYSSITKNDARCYLRGELMIMPGIETVKGMALLQKLVQMGKLIASNTQIIGLPIYKPGRFDRLSTRRAIYPILRNSMNHSATLDEVATLPPDLNVERVYLSFYNDHKEYYYQFAKRGIHVLAPAFSPIKGEMTYMPWHWIVCGCGNVKMVPAYFLPGVRSCGMPECGYHKKWSKTMGDHNHGENKKSIRGWKLSREFYDNIREQDCVACGRKPTTYVKSVPGRKALRQGWTETNVIPLCWHCFNFSMMHRMDFYAMLEWARKLVSCSGERRI